MGFNEADAVCHKQGVSSVKNGFSGDERGKEASSAARCWTPPTYFKRCLIFAVLFLLLVTYRVLQPQSGFVLFQGTGIPAWQTNSTGSVAAFLALGVGRVSVDPEHVPVWHNAPQVSPGVVRPKVGDAETLVRDLRVDFGTQLSDSRCPWEVAASWVNARELVPEHAPELGAVLNALATAPITFVDFLSGFKGKQLKLAFKLDGKQTVAFKPKWYDRDNILEGVAIVGRDRHNGEIAAFHLSRVLGFRRVPIAAGRRVTIGKELAPVASVRLLKTFYQKDGDTCLYGRCQNCVEETGVCAKGDNLEGVIILWLPSSVQLKSITHPWYHSFKEKLLARYHTNESYCSIVRQMSPFNESGYLLLDVIDTAIFDFLISNADRHHCEIIRNMERGMLVMLDNGKSFGNPFQDEMNILDPLRECCVLRHTTWKQLTLLRHNVLSYVMEQLLKADSLQPVLSRDHLLALDRRLGKVWMEIDECVRALGLDAVLIQDG